MVSSKYGNVKTPYRGQLFHSKKEATYAKLLDTMRRASNLRERVASYQAQVPYPIVINGHKICTYLADFLVVYGDGRTEVVDVKGFKTAVYKLKKALVEAAYNLTIVET